MTTLLRTLGDIRDALSELYEAEARVEQQVNVLTGPLSPEARERAEAEMVQRVAYREHLRAIRIARLGWGK